MKVNALPRRRGRGVWGGGSYHLVLEKDLHLAERVWQAGKAKVNNEEISGRTVPSTPEKMSLLLLAAARAPQRIAHDQLWSCGAPQARRAPGDMSASVALQSHRIALLTTGKVHFRPDRPPTVDIYEGRKPN